MCRSTALRHKPPARFPPLPGALVLSFHLGGGLWFWKGLPRWGAPQTGNLPERCPVELMVTAVPGSLRLSDQL